MSQYGLSESIPCSHSPQLVTVLANSIICSMSTPRFMQSATCLSSQAPFMLGKRLFKIPARYARRGINVPCLATIRFDTCSMISPGASTTG